MARCALQTTKLDIGLQFNEHAVSCSLQILDACMGGRVPDSVYREPFLDAINARLHDLIQKFTQILDPSIIVLF